ncbi:ATP-binding protein [Puniceicoccaceae bacterium K14]|nr:ATP-binding protein [Puniceicoccaceae bacterium K14]
MRVYIFIFLLFAPALVFGRSQGQPQNDFLETIHSLRANTSVEAARELQSIQVTLFRNGDTPKNWRPLLELGITYKHNEDYENSQKCFERLIESASKVDAVDWITDSYENLADLGRWKLDYDQALEYGLKALKNSRRSKNKNLVSEIHFSIGKTFEKMDMEWKAAHSYSQAIATAVKSDPPKHIGKAHLYLSQILKSSGKFKEAASHALLSSDYLPTFGRPLDLRQSYELISYCQIKLGDYDKALEAATLGLDAAAKSKREGDEIILLGYLTTIYRKIGFYDQALKHGLDALNIAEETGTADNIATAALQLAVIHQTTGNPDETKIYLDRVFELEEKNIKQKYIASALKTLSQVHSQNSNFDKALFAAGQALDKYSIIHDEIGIAGSLFNLAEIYRNMGNIESAITQFDSSLKYYEQSSDRYGKSNSLIQLGPLYFEKGSKKYGIDLIKQGIKEAEEIAASTLLLDGYRMLFTLQRENNEDKSAAISAEKYIELQDSILSKEALSRLSNMQFISKIDQKQKEINKLQSERIINELELESNAQQIELLNRNQELQRMQLSESKSTRLILVISILLIAAILLLTIVRYRYLQKIRQTLQEKNDAIKRSNDQLQEVNQSKDQFFTMIAHDLKNSIGNLTFCMQFVNTENFIPKDADAKKLLNSLRRSATESHQLLLNLLQWAKMQMSRIELREQPIVLIEVIEATSEVFSNSLLNKELKLVVDIDKKIVVETDENILKTILRNLLHNAIKFSNRGGIITISGEPSDGSFLLSVRDEGVGLPTGFQSKIADSKKFVHGSGTEGEVGSGIGIAVCNWLLKLSTEELYFANNDSGGTTVSFTIPLQSTHLTEISIASNSVFTQ